MPETNCLYRHPDAKRFARHVGWSILISGLGFTVPISATAEQPPFTGGLLEFDNDIPQVLTTTRLRQPKTRVPGSTTVIPGDKIRDLGIMNLYEVFRLVPGMTVNFVGSHQPVATYHGTVHYEQRRMQVLIDGRTAHRATLSDMDWETMPVPLELIERIEVARGPNSAAYGINAFLGTINIITRDPVDTVGAEARVTRGSRNHIRTFASVGGAGQVVDWRLSYEKRKFGGFDYQEDGGERVSFNDGHNINSFGYDSRFKLNRSTNIEVKAGVTDGVKQQDKGKSGELDPIEHPNVDVRDYFIQSQFNHSSSEHHFFHVLASVSNFKRRNRYDIELGESAIACLRGSNGPSLYFRTQDPNDGSRLEPCQVPVLGETPLRANVNEDYEDTRLELEIQDTLLFNDDLKLVSGAGFRKNILRSETYFNGREHSYQSRYFGNLEYTPWPWMTLNLGGNWEHSHTTDEDYFSPRVATNFVINSHHAIRFVYSQAVRTPDTFEQSPNTGYTLRHVTPDIYSDLEGRRLTIVDAAQEPHALTLGRDLEEERIRSHEISYFGQFPLPSALLSIEVRGFKDEMRDMVSGVIQLAQWTLGNNVDVYQKGFEVEATLDYPNTALRATYAYLDQDSRYIGPPILDATGAVDTQQQDYQEGLLSRMSTRHSGSFSIIQNFPFDLKASSAFYWADEFLRTENQFERIDVRLAKQFFRTDYTAEIAITMQHYLNREPELSSDNNIDDHNQFFVEAGVRF
ncbi:TonB-dependent receptor domain-containing protein [Marinobacter sp. AL4B]|uniref:TonB-dependent receptor plug domain-containing protein n=1 Tax=Marinobacter sp. AL4B TaxID=2871173 RepID=UPI001CAA7EA9|nr:TonB-dependent receptor [Marinobacter sp. AL4B]